MYISNFATFFTDDYCVYASSSNIAVEGGTG